MARGLTDEDIAGLRQQVEAGKRPRVQLSGPHFPVGATGTVVRVGQPEQDGPDYLRVRVKVDNMTDELAFGPAELSLPGRARPARKTAASKAAANRGAEKKAAGKSTSTPKAPARSTPSKAPAPRATLAASTVSEPIPVVPTKSTPTKTIATNSAAAPVTPAAARSGRRRSGPVQKVSFTISSAGASWSVTATRGSKNLVKNAPLSPGMVSAVAELLDQAALTAAVGEINDVALAEAQARADELRAELSRLEAVLATHTRP